MPFTCVEATWIQPKVTCSGRGLSAVAFWVGMGGFNQHALVQAGTQAACVHGAPQITAWHQSLPMEPFAIQTDLVVNVGDQVHSRVLFQAGSTYELLLENLTAGTSFRVTADNSILDPTSAEWIVEAPTIGCPSACQVSPLPNFRTLTFTDVAATIGGVRGPLDAPGFSHTRTTLITQSGAVRSTVTTTGADGTTFVVSWRRR